MAKRKQEDGLTTNGSAEVISEVPAAKKARKEKSANTPAPQDGERKSKKKSKKDEGSLDVKSEASELLSAIKNGEPDAEAVAKAKRKALKKEKKRAEKEAKKALETNEQEPNVVDNKSQLDEKAKEMAEQKALKKAEKRAKKEDKKAGKSVAEGAEDSESATLLEKAARKAEKARKKAEKKIAKSEASTTQTATPVNGISAASSVAHSKSESSATSPEPVTPAESAESGYQEAAGLLALPQSEIDAYLGSKQITIADDHKASHYRPILNFSHLPITDEAERAPFKGFTSPTPIQAATWPYLLAGRDVVGVAETGSGKTIAFGVPCMRYIKNLTKADRQGVKAVVVSPTRELALQIQEQLEKLASPAGLRVVCVYGGVDKQPQRSALKRANIVVATPGRLNDLIDEGAADLSGAGYVVLDEADRMLDVGFEKDIRKIISTTSSSRQTLMFTATWPPSVRELASSFMNTPVKIIIGDNPTGELRANTRIEQIVEVVQPLDKQMRLIQLLKEHQSGAKQNDKILVFCLYKKEADRIEHFIRTKGFKVAGIHGDLSQQRRMESLDKFKRGEVTLLVATDVAARGLDIPAVKVVINVTFPLTAEDYVHRIGRTGRAGLDGKAITLFTEHDKGNSGPLINVLRAANQPIPDALLKFGTTVKKKEHSAYGAFFKEVDMTKKATRVTFD